MAFRYMNPGFVSLLDSDVTATETTETTYSKTGVAFSQTNSSAGITIPTFAEGDDFWARLDIYIPENVTGNIYLCVPRAYRVGFYLHIYNPSDVVSLYLYYSGKQQQIAKTTSENRFMEKGKINTVIFHLKYGNSSNSFWEVFINDFSKQLSGGYDMTYSTSYENKVKLYADVNTVFFSNIIFSNEDVSKEQIITLPISQTVTDMTAGENGIYIADAANQTLLQSVDVTELIQNYGANSKVTGIVVVGNPAYKTATGLANLTALSKSGENISEHNTCALSDDTTASVADSWGLSGVTISDLQNMQFGWKVGE